MHTRLAHIALLLALVSWIAGLTGGLVHAIEVVHVRCAEHGEQVEWAANHSDTSELDQVRAPSSPEEHGHGCLLTLAHTGQALVQMPVSIPESSTGTRCAINHHRAAHGSRLLHDAPKTSPPIS